MRTRTPKDLHPTFPQLVALASAAIHAEEIIQEVNTPDPRKYLSRGFNFDLHAFLGALSTPGVRDWLGRMQEGGFLPVKRTGP
jgi:hypothetical protein